jgi:hypothetical protein
MTDQQSGPKSPGRALSEQFTQRPPDDVVAQIEEERRRRLDPANRPEGAEVDNTHRQFDSEAGMFTDAPGYRELPDDAKPYDDAAGEVGASHRRADPAPGRQEPSPPTR